MRNHIWSTKFPGGIRDKCIYFLHGRQHLSHSSFFTERNGDTSEDWFQLFECLLLFANCSHRENVKPTWGDKIPEESRFTIPILSGIMPPLHPASSVTPIWIHHPLTSVTLPQVKHSLPRKPWPPHRAVHQIGEIERLLDKGGRIHPSKRVLCNFLLTLVDRDPCSKARE